MKNADTPLANEIREILASGKLVSDELTFQVVKERIAREDCKRTYILDGFPRTILQAELLEMLAQEQGKNIQTILVDIPLDHLEKRMIGRRSCPVCGEIYNIYFKPPKFDNVCDLHPEAELTHRADDTEEKVKVRLATYDEQTKPLLDYYAKSGRLQRVDGNQSVEEIYSELDKLI